MRMKVISINFCCILQNLIVELLNGWRKRKENTRIRTYKASISKSWHCKYWEIYHVAYRTACFTQSWQMRSQIVPTKNNLRYAWDSLNPHEEFIGLHVVPNICADTLVACIRDTLIHMNLSIQNCRGQCYDGASNMAGSKSGVASQIKTKEPRAIFTHCYGHSLQLAVGETVKGI